MSSLALQQYLLFSVIYIMLGWSLYLPYKVGQFTWAGIYCMAVGAYISAYAATELHWPFVASLVVGTVAGALVSLPPAWGLRKSSGFATVIASLAVVFIFQAAMKNWGAVGGAQGMFGISHPAYLLPVALVALLLVGGLIHRADSSRFGRAAEALLVNRDVAASLSVSLGSWSVAFQIAAGTIGGLAGVLYAYSLGSVTPSAFGANLLIMACAPLFVGGASTLWGTVVLAPIFWGIPLFVPSSISEWRDIYIAVIVGVVLLTRSHGLITRSTLRAISGVVRRLGKERSNKAPSL